MRSDIDRYLGIERGEITDDVLERMNSFATNLLHSDEWYLIKRFITQVCLEELKFDASTALDKPERAFSNHMRLAGMQAVVAKVEGMPSGIAEALKEREQGRTQEEEERKFDQDPSGYGEGEEIGSGDISV